jgi:hypothetical protein
MMGCKRMWHSRWMLVTMAASPAGCGAHTQRSSRAYSARDPPYCCATTANATGCTTSADAPASGPAAPPAGSPVAAMPSLLTFSGPTAATASMAAPAAAAMASRTCKAAQLSVMCPYECCAAMCTLQPTVHHPDMSSTALWRCLAVKPATSPTTQPSTFLSSTPCRRPRTP